MVEVGLVDPGFDINYRLLLCVAVDLMEVCLVVCSTAIHPSLGC